MIRATSYPKIFSIGFCLLLFMSAIWTSETRAMSIIARCQADPETVFQTVKESTQAMDQWRSVRYVDDQRAVKAMVRNWRNYAVPVVIQVQTSPREDLNNVAELHIYWEQTMDPVNYPDMFFFMDTFWNSKRRLA